MNNNLNRENYVQTVGKNYFGGIDNLMKAKLDFMETVIDFLQLVRITVADSEADPNLAAIYTKEITQVRSATTAGEPKTLSEVKQYIEDGYNEIFKLFVATRRMPEIGLIEYYNQNEPDMMAAYAVQEAFSHFCNKERNFISACSDLLFNEDVLPILAKLANVRRSHGSRIDDTSRLLAAGEVSMNIKKELSNGAHRINILREKFGRDLGEAEEFTDKSEDRDSVLHVYFRYFNPGKKILELCSTSDEMGTLFPPRTGRLDF
jgi:hypothetical protein